MKLLFFISSLRGGGAERVMVTICNELVNRGYEVNLATNTSIPFAYEVDSRVQIIDLCPKRNKKGIINKLVNKIISLKSIRNIVKRVKPDVIVSFIVDLSSDVLISTIDLKIPVIASEHSTFDTNNSISRFFKRYHINKLASKVTVLTRHDYDFIGKRLSNKVVMPNPLSFEINPGQSLRSQVVLAAGSIDRWEGKGFDTLINIWGKISPKFPDWKLQIAGSGTLENFDYLKRIANSNNIDKTVEFLGFQSNLQQYLQKSSIFVLSSKYEGLPMTLIEAISQGCSSISFDCTTGPREIITHNKSGLLVENQNVEEMANSLELLMSDEKMRNRLSKGGLCEAEKFSVKIIADQWEDLFKIVKN